LPARWARLTTWLLTPAAVGGLLGVAGWLRWTEPPMARYGYAVCGICSLVIIGDLVAGQSGWLRRLLSARPLVWTGKVSYGLYLWHYPIFAALREGAPDATWPWVFAAGTVLSFAAAAASYYLVERRCLALKRYFEPGQRQPAQPRLTAVRGRLIASAPAPAGTGGSIPA
jgi:peptidoglycan/LPS O-acetylase OafA/YrhL